MNFLELGLSPALCKTLETIGYTTPTPIQQQTIPHVLQGKDVLASAQTGTGKTASFLLPLIQKLLDTPGRARLARAVILEPTRELALQVMQSFQAFTADVPLKAALLVGGESMLEQQKILGRGVDILIATPGRLLDLIERGQIMLLGIQYVIIDEADRMLDMGFIPDINRLMAALPPQKQTLLFSATFPNEIKKLADTYLKTPEHIHITPENRTAATIKQYFLKVGPLEKREALRYVLEKFAKDEQCIVFCNRKRDISLLLTALKKYGYQTAALHGDLAQSARSETVKQFKEGVIKILVASDIAARGLDVENLSLVVNFDIPHQPEDYVHRIGRTGRAGQLGIAFSLVSPHDQKAWQAVEKSIDQKLEPFEWEAPVKVLEKPVPRVAAQPNRTKEQQQQPPRPRENDRMPYKKHPSQDDFGFDSVVGFGDFVPAFMLTTFQLNEMATAAQDTQ
ncbi:DEAD/DEAH box helicase [Candidatus Finniella inopinata]|uniref:DEAD/DEAH box helicase n=1 Tax=Candidatus Finniella inopinata TaxID=1696036 RepID=A0A4Q7DG95_9PROT|nr:DEAD/DEAH box helicase [Candidatus Finniella inopinata]RZI45208.1 DEAD/DEAH box helicase [Candidatus Finniella inopinata]